MRDMTTCDLSVAKDNFNRLRSDHESDALRTLQKEVRDLKVAMTALTPAIRGFHEDKVNNYKDKVKNSSDNLYFYNTLSTLRMAALEHAPAIEMVKVEKAAQNTDDHDKIERLVSRVAALEKPWYNPFTTTKPRASDPTNMTALLRRMDEFNS